MAPTNGVSSLCMQHFTQLSNATLNTGYTWKSVQPAIATVNNSGRVQAVTPGTVNIRFIAANAAGCFDSTDITLTVNALPVMQPITSATNAFTVCEHSSLQLLNTTIRQTNTWLSLQPALAGIDAVGKLTALQQGSVVVRFIATDVAGCTDSTDATITVLHSPMPSVTIAASVNPICDKDEVLFTAQDVNGGSAPQWQWQVNGVAAGNNSSAFRSKKMKNGDVVSCRLVSNAVCALPSWVNSNTIQMQVNPLPVVKVASNRTTLLKEDAAQLQGSATGTIGAVRWTPAFDLNNDTVFNPVARPLTTTLYQLTVTSKDGCAASDTIRINVVDRFLIPNAFSPNGDGIHDRWEVDYLDKFPGATIQVFNRYGQMIYQTSSYQRNSGWDGRMNGLPLPMGTYYYIIDLKNGRPRFSGSITILK
jgi:gliding motility-associated-like protein